MNKPKTTVGDWLKSVFGGSYQKISEALTAEEFSGFVNEAGALHPRSDTEEPESKAQNAETTGEQLDTKTLKMADYEALTKAKADGEAKITLLEAEASKLKAELEQSQSKAKAELKQKDDYVAKLKASINPIGEEDLNTVGAEAPILTKSDVEARKAWEKLHKK